MRQATKQSVYDFWCDEATTVESVANYFSISQKEVEAIINEFLDSE